MEFRNELKEACSHIGCIQEQAYKMIIMQYAMRYPPDSIAQIATYHTMKSIMSVKHLAGLPDNVTLENLNDIPIPDYYMHLLGKPPSADTQFCLLKATYIDPSTGDNDNQP